MVKIYTTKSVQQTHDIAAEIARRLSGGEVLALTGDLGAGKTTFTQGLAKALGVSRNVNSPTFIIHRSYKVEHPTILKFNHIDLYRIENEAELEGLGLEEIFDDKHGLIVLEWPEKMGGLLPKERIDIKFEYIAENERQITIINSKTQVSSNY